jgi:ubiquinone biosynthesis protein
MAELSSGIKFGQRIRNMGRMAQVTNVFARNGLYSLFEEIGVKSWLRPEDARKAKEIARQQGDTQDDERTSLTEISGAPARLRLTFEELGPAFVKLGQLLAVREDLLPKAFCEELSKLHSGVSTLPYSEIKKILDEELGPDILSGFSKINETPLAAGSIAQVHEATLSTGEEVVIKVQRPGIVPTINTDLNLMEDLAGLIEKYIPEARFARPQSVVTEFKRATLTELDFVREAGNISKIAINFANENYLKVPTVHWKFSSSRIVTMTKMIGEFPNDREQLIAANINPELLVERGLNAFLKMVFLDGLYHGDLHPGNILALPDTKVGLIDFGVVVHISRSMRENLAGLLVAIVDEDYERAVMHYMEMADPALDFDASSFEHEIANAIAPFIGLSLGELGAGHLFWNIAGVAARHGAPMPQELIVFVRTLSSFEAIGRKLDPNFDVLSAAKSFSGEIAKEIYAPDKVKAQALMLARDAAQLAKHAPYQIRRLLRAALEGDLNLNINSGDMADFSVALDRASSRLSLSFIIAALIIGSSILTFARVGKELYSLSVFGLGGFALAGLMAFFLFINLIRGSRK